MRRRHQDEKGMFVEVSALLSPCGRGAASKAFHYRAQATLAGASAPTEF